MTALSNLKFEKVFILDFAAVIRSNVKVSDTFKQSASNFYRTFWNITREGCFN